MTGAADRPDRLDPGTGLGEAADRLLRGEAFGDEVTILERFLDDVATAIDGPPPPRSAALEAALRALAPTRAGGPAAGVPHAETRAAGSGRAGTRGVGSGRAETCGAGTGGARMRRPSSPGRSPGRWAAALGVVGKVAVGVAVAGSAAAGAEVAGILPDPVGGAVRHAVEVVTPFELPGDDPSPGESAEPGSPHAGGPDGVDDHLHPVEGPVGPTPVGPGGASGTGAAPADGASGAPGEATVAENGPVADAPISPSAPSAVAIDDTRVPAGGTADDAPDDHAAAPVRPGGQGDGASQAEPPGPPDRHGTSSAGPTAPHSTAAPPDHSPPAVTGPPAAGPPFGGSAPAVPAVTGPPAAGPPFGGSAPAVPAATGRPAAGPPSPGGPASSVPVVAPSPADPGSSVPVVAPSPGGQHGPAGGDRPSGVGAAPANQQPPAGRSSGRSGDTSAPAGPPGDALPPGAGDRDR